MSDDDLAGPVPAGSKLDGRADLLHREAGGDGHPKLARRDQASKPIDGTRVGVGAVRRREAGVGIGTLSRHFPTRESLVDAVYRDQVARLTAGARDLLAELSPTGTLRRWMDLFGDWIATKNGMLDTLLAMIESGEIPHAQTQTELLTAIDDILNAGRATGELRADVTAEDIAASLIGIFTVAHPPEHSARANRLLNILMDGLRPTS
jgi:AcrR family transcriptional regulator